MTPSDPNTARLGSILERIVASKRAEVEALKSRISLQEMRARAAAAPAPLDFRAGVVRPGCVRLIAEIKKASPSKGLIRENFDPVEIARSYESAGAAAISVLTDAPFFQGSLEIFRAVRGVVRIPMLRKEFMIDPIQFYEARAAGADAVLLITSILTPAQLSEFYGLALDLGMTALVETHSETDVRRALTEIRPSLLGINNRDLHDERLHAILEHTGNMMPIINEIVGSSRTAPSIVSESGIHSADDVARLRDWGVSAVLVGESLMRQPDTVGAVRALMARSG
jgi:indole-3-glycerol phosphate synthase